VFAKYGHPSPAPEAGQDNASPPGIILIYIRKNTFYRHRNTDFGPGGRLGADLAYKHTDTDTDFGPGVGLGVGSLFPQRPATTFDFAPKAQEEPVLAGENEDGRTRMPLPEKLSGPASGTGGGGKAGRRAAPPADVDADMKSDMGLGLGSLFPPRGGARSGGAPAPHNTQFSARGRRQMNTNGHNGSGAEAGGRGAEVPPGSQSSSPPDEKSREQSGVTSSVLSAEPTPREPRQRAEGDKATQFSHAPLQLLGASTGHPVGARPRSPRSVAPPEFWYLKGDPLASTGTPGGAGPHMRPASTADSTRSKGSKKTLGPGFLGAQRSPAEDANSPTRNRIMSLHKQVHNACGVLSALGLVS
jgi:hypothetical protein